MARQVIAYMLHPASYFAVLQNRQLVYFSYNCQRDFALRDKLRCELLESRPVVLLVRTLPDKLQLCSIRQRFVASKLLEKCSQ